MDPTACLIAMLDAHERCDTDSFNGYKQSLLDWLNDGNFGPKVTVWERGNIGPKKHATLTKIYYDGHICVRFANNRTREYSSWRCIVDVIESDAAKGTTFLKVSP